MEITRREALRLIVYGASSVVAGATLARGDKLSAVRGCCLQKGRLNEFEAQGSGFGALSQDLIDSTGSKSLDSALGKALVKLADAFGERPGFGFIDDRGRPNAYASPESSVAGTWGTVMFGQSMFSDLLGRYDDNGVAILAVVAHEFGHIAQFRSGLHDRLLTGQSTVRRVELHADYLSGYYLGSRKRIDPALSVWAAGHTLFSIGDYQFQHRDHHGTPEQRVAAAESGFELGSRGESYDTAFAQGATYVSGKY